MKRNGHGKGKGVIYKKVKTLNQAVCIQLPSLKGCKNWRFGPEKRVLSKEL